MSMRYVRVWMNVFVSTTNNHKWIASKTEYIPFPIEKIEDNFSGIAGLDSKCVSWPSTAQLARFSSVDEICAQAASWDA